jgi:hypothetical protein
MMIKFNQEKIKIPEATRKNWQDIIDIMAKLAGIPAGLIMRINDENIEVFLASNSKNNPYEPGSAEPWRNSGLYCETVINAQQPLLVKNALEDLKWRNNPDIKLNMISYLGFPIDFPDQTPFGTLCILDNKPNGYSGTIHKMMEKFRDLVESQLELLVMNHIMGEENRRLSDYLDELQTIRGIIPICAICKKVKNSEGYWNTVEKYLMNHPYANFSHGLCPDCYEKEKEQFEELEKISGKKS